MKKDDFKTRLAEIATNLADLNSDNEDTKKDSITKKSVMIHIVTTLPILLLEDESLQTIKLSETQYAPVDDSEIKNTLTDVNYFKENNVERFVFLTQILSFYNNSKIRLYYDRKYEDIIVVPNLTTLGTDPDIGNGIYEIIGGYRIGSGKSIKVEHELVIGTQEVDRKRLPVTNQHISNTCYSILGKGLTKSDKLKTTFNGQYDGFEIMQNDTQMGIMINLGSIEDVFEHTTDDDGNAVISHITVPVYQAYTATSTMYHGKYIGDVHTKDKNLFVVLDI